MGSPALLMSLLCLFSGASVTSQRPARHGGRRSSPVRHDRRWPRCAKTCEQPSPPQLTLSLTDCHIWFNFFHRGLFFKSFFTQEMGAHVVYAIMSHMIFLREGNTKTGQVRARHFAEEAGRMIEYCLNHNHPEPTLAQTALLLVAFEFQPHIQQNLSHATTALGFMEACARTCLPYWSSSRDSSATKKKPWLAAETTSGIRQEEMRQMCWTLSHLAANSTIWRHFVGQPPLCLSSADPAKASSYRLSLELIPSSPNYSHPTSSTPIARPQSCTAGRSTALQYASGTRSLCFRANIEAYRVEPRPGNPLGRFRFRASQGTDPGVGFGTVRRFAKIPLAGARVGDSRTGACG